MSSGLSDIRKLLAKNAEWRKFSTQKNRTKYIVRLSIEYKICYLNVKAYYLNL